ncbi:MAG: fibronectin type III domain-containing protein [Caldilineales bacterium]|nr:fibronectin type III domain-containing protein [Caldilineales bacterium]MCW5858030.1 fibronectin type III domain-containing protein [Caldilineales bacterium]
MSRTTHIALHLLAVFGIAASLIALVPAPPLRAAAALPDDTPVPVVNDNVEEWTAGQGLLYWANNCFADEFNPFAELKRKPSSGGQERTLVSINDYSRCWTFQNLLSAGDGLYYYSGAQSRIERMPLAEPFTAQEVKTLNTNQTPSTGKALVEGGDYLYWIYPYGKVFRTRKDGTGNIETVADTASSPIDVMVVGDTVFWSDSAGVWTISTGCGALPCTGTQSQFVSFGANTNGFGLLYVYLGTALGRYNVYWVQRTTSGNTYTYQIRYRSCTQVTICTIAPPSTFYSATTNWQIGSPVFANNNLYWTERDISTPNNATGDVKRKARTDTSTGADTIASGQSGIDPRLFVANGLLFFARRSVGIYTLALDAAAILRDFTADALEVTQAIQNLANAAPLAANKATYVRTYGKQISGPSAANVEARLAGVRNGSPLPGSPLAPINGVRALTTGGGYDRARLNDGWYFQLPSSWTNAGAITLKFQVDPRLIHTDPNRADNELTTTVSFQSQPPVCVWTVPVRTHTPLPSTTDPNFWDMVDHFDRRWPVPQTWVYRDTEPVEELQVCWAGPFPYPCFGPYELEDEWGLTNGPPDRDKVIVSLWTRALLTFNPDSCDNIGAPVHFMGMVHPDANNGGASGYASLHSNQSWVQLPGHTPNPIPPGWNNVRPGRVMAQELAHNYGRKHIDCGNPSDIDGSYPYPPCQISNIGADQYYGFDIRTLTPIRPDQASDFMTYGSSQWVSDYTWRALINDFAGASTSAVPAATEAGNSVFVSGWVDAQNNRGKIGSLLVMPTSSIPPATRQAASSQAMPGSTDEATFRLRLLDSNGATLANRTLTPIEMDNHTADGESALFSDLFTQPGGQVATVQLLADTTVIDSLTPGVHPPVVAIQQPTSGAVIDDSLVVQWTASDPDPGDHLLYTVQYSHDSGATWHTMTTNYPGSPGGGTLTLTDLGSLSGSAANRARIRVLASDGYNTGIAVSQPFTVKNRRPDAFIIAPAAGETFLAGQPVMLHGGATDAEDGGLSDAALAWTIDGNDVGSGSDATTAGLAPGAHTATLNATDADSNTGTAEVDFTVATLGLPLTAFMSLDGVCDDGGYAAGATVPLQPYGDGSQATVRLVRTDGYLWACFFGLKKGAVGAFAGVRADVDHSRSAQAQASDYGFFLAEDGSVFTYAGNGAGGFTEPGPGGLQAQVNIGANTWSGELRIDKNVLGGWDHLVGMMAGHYAVSAQGNDYVWPFTGVSNRPRTWATTALGDQPVISAITPYTATVGDPAFSLSVEGSGFSSGAVGLWDGDELATTVVDSSHLTVEVAAEKIASAGTAQVSVRSPSPGDFESNEVPFEIEAPAPAITSLSPSSVQAGSPTTTLAVHGSGFSDSSQVLWNGAPLTTQFVSPTEVRAQLAASLLAVGQTAGVAVRNQLPHERISNSEPFEVTPANQANQRLFLPRLRR